MATATPVSVVYRDDSSAPSRGTRLNTFGPTFMQAEDKSWSGLTSVDLFGDDSKEEIFYVWETKDEQPVGNPVAKVGF